MPTLASSLPSGLNVTVQTQMVFPNLVECTHKILRHWPVFTSHNALRGGSSDANYAIEHDIPVLDGLGPIGGNDHSPIEHLKPATHRPFNGL